MPERQLVFHVSETTTWFFLCVAAIVVAAVLITALLRYERQLVSWPVGFTLLALRLGVLAALLLTLLEPVLSWTIRRETTGRVVVAVDLSESMSTVDRHATEAEKLRWARGTGFIGNSNIDDRLNRWTKAFEASQEPEWIDPEEDFSSERRQQVAEARRESLQTAFAEIDHLSRKEIARRILTGTAAPLLSILEQVGATELRAFAGQSDVIDSESLERWVAQSPNSLDLQSSNLTKALQSSLEDSETSRILGVVLLTDGRDTSEGDPASLAARLGVLDVPIYPVLLGSERHPADLAIARLDFPSTVFLDDHTLLKADLTTSGFEGQDIEVSLEREGAEPVTKTIRVAGPESNVEFELDARELGRHEYTLRADVLPGETREDNNHKTFALNVIDDTIRVLLVDGAARWEFRFIDNALSRDSRVELRHVVFRQPYLGVLPEPFFPRRLEWAADNQDVGNAPFDNLDLMILGDIAPEHVPPLVWERLEAFVAESGGTLVLTAGKRDFPLTYQSPIVDRLLPVTDLREVDIAGDAALRLPTERGFHLRLTPDGAGEPMLQFDADPEANREIWAGLPGHLWGLLGRAKPGATVYATAVVPDGDNPLEAERQAGMIVHQHYGLGQVLWVGIDSTWRWRHRVGDQYHHRFWGQLGRWAAENKSASGNKFVKFGLDRSDIEVGDTVAIGARWTNFFVEKFPNLKARVEIFRVDDAGKSEAAPVTTVELVPREGRSLVHEARVDSLSAGEYRLKLVADNAELGPEDVATSLYVHAKQGSELSDLRSNRKLLTQLAEASGGRLFLADEVSKIPEQFQPAQRIQQLSQEVTLWDHWAVLTLFFTLLTTEWGVRKWNGLP